MGLLDVLDFRFVVAGLSLGSLYGLSGTGLVVIYRETGVLHLAYGAIGALCAFASWDLLDRGAPGLVVWLLAPVLGVVLSVAYGRWMAPLLARRPAVEQMAATLGLALVVWGATSWHWTSTIRRSLTLGTDAWDVSLLDVRVSGTRLLALFLGLAITVGVSVWLRLSPTGLAMRAVANDRDLSGVLGVGVVRVESFAWAMSGALAGLTGLLLGALTQLDPTTLTFLVIPAIAAAVVGRLDSLALTWVGGLAIGLAESLATPYASVTRFRSAAPFVVATAVILWRQRRSTITIYEHPTDRPAASPAVAGPAFDARVSGRQDGKGDGAPSSLIPASEAASAGRSRPSHRAGRAVRRGVGSPVGLGLVATGVVALVLPGVVSSFWLSVSLSAAIFAVAAAGVAVPYGALGMVSLAQVALVAVGGWLALRFGFAFGWPFEVVVLAAGMVTGAVGVVVGLPALRMRGVYLALVTLMAAGAVQVVATARNFPNGGSGFWGRALPGEATRLLDRPALAGSDAAYFRYVLVVAALAFVLVLVHTRARPGRAWALIRTSDAAALSAGVNVTLYKTWAFGLAGFLAGVSGALLAGNLGQLQAQSFFAPESILLFALVVVGGPRFLAGAVVAGVLYRIVPARLNEWGLDPDLSLVLFGVALVYTLVSAPEGIAGQLRALPALARSRLGRRAAA